MLDLPGNSPPWLTECTSWWRRALWVQSLRCRSQWTGPECGSSADVGRFSWPRVLHYTVRPDSL